MVNHGNANSTPLHSCFLPSEGFTIRFDPGNEYVAIGCNNGTRLLYSIKDSTHRLRQMKWFRGSTAPTKNQLPA